MSQRLRPRDLALLAHETPATPMHKATVEIFDPGDSGFDHDRLLTLIEERISFVPRYRSRLQSVPGRLATPAWVDDPHFDLAFHVRRSALPRPGSMEQLRELVARIVSRPLDRSRPLWEAYVVEGLEDGRVAVLWKSHLALVDGIDTVDLGQVLLDPSPELRSLGGDEWLPGQRSSPLGVLSTAVTDVVQDPRLAWDAVRANTASVVRVAGGAADRAGRVAGALANRRPVPDSPISGELSQQRRVVTVRTDLADHRRVREAQRLLGQRRRAGDGRRGAPELADDPRRVARWRTPDPGGGAGVGDRRGARGHLAGQPDRPPLGGPAGGGAQPGRPAAPGVVLVRGPPRDRPRRRRRPAGGDVRVRARDLPRGRVRGSRPRSCAAASSSPSPTCPARSRRSSPAAPGCSRPTRSPRCCPGTRSRSA